MIRMESVKAMLFSRFGKQCTTCKPKVATFEQEEEVVRAYDRDPDWAQLKAGQYGIDLSALVHYYGLREELTGWELGVQHGKEEKAGKRETPGAVRLGILQWRHGQGYILGRQHALVGDDMTPEKAARILNHAQS